MNNVFTDPTADAAIGRVDNDKKVKKKQKRARMNELKKRPRVYVVSAYAGDTEGNTEKAIEYCRYVIEKGCIPVASHLMYPQILDDEKPREREMGQMFGLSLLSICSAVWVFGDKATEGMLQEVNEALRLKIPVTYVKRVK